jgi:hypothetical protein
LISPPQLPCNFFLPLQHSWWRSATATSNANIFLARIECTILLPYAGTQFLQHTSLVIQWYIALRDVHGFTVTNENNFSKMIPM